MEGKFRSEGIVISKVLFKERDLICHLLCRSGDILSILFPGGAGGGKKQKGSIIELGFMLGVDYFSKESQAEVKRAKEWSLIWNHNHIRNDYRAFLMLSHFCEVSGKFGHSTDDSIFRLLSNALVHLDEKLEGKSFNLDFEVALFHAKLLIALGIFPDINSCIHCSGPLVGNPLLSNLDGGFSCEQCVGSQIDDGQNSLLAFLREVAFKKYRDVTFDLSKASALNRILIQYLCFQLHVDINSLASLKQLSV